MVADLEAKPVKPRYSQEDRDRVQADAILIGVRPAARKHGINEDTVCAWAAKGGWKLPSVLVELRKQATSRGSQALQHIAASIDEHGEHSRLYLSAATLQASHALAAQGGQTKGERVPYAGLLNVSRSGDTVHGWQAQRTAGPTVQIANVILPTPQEQAERQAMFAKLEEITRRLAAPQP